MLLELELPLILLTGESGGVVLLLLIGVGAPGTVATGKLRDTSVPRKGSHS